MQQKIAAWFPFALFVAMATLMATAGLLDLGLPFWLALPVGLISGIASAYALVVISLLFTRERRRLLFALPRNLHALAILNLRKPAHRDFAIARKASGHPGTAHTDADLTLWTDAESFTLFDCQEILRRTARSMESRLGHPFPPEGKLRILIFAQFEAMRRYTPAPMLAGLPTEFGGYYNKHHPSRIVISTEFRDLFPFTSHSLLAHEAAHYLHLNTLGNTLPPAWLAEGVATSTAAHVCPPPPSLAIGIRRYWHFLEATGSLLTGRDLIEIHLMGYRHKTEKSQSAKNRATHLRTLALYLQSQALFDELCDRRRPALLDALLHPEKIHPHSADAFTRHFRISPDDAMQSALIRQRNPPSPPTAESPEETAARHATARQLIETLTPTPPNSPPASQARQLIALRLLPLVAHDLDPAPLHTFHATTTGHLKDVAALTLEMLTHEFPPSARICTSHPPPLPLNSCGRETRHPGL